MRFTIILVNKNYSQIIMDLWKENILLIKLFHVYIFSQTAYLSFISPVILDYHILKYPPNVLFCFIGLKSPAKWIHLIQQSTSVSSKAKLWHSFRVRSWSSRRAASALQLHHPLLPGPRRGLPWQRQRDHVRYPLPEVGRPGSSRASLLPKHIRVQVGTEKQHEGGRGGGGGWVCSKRVFKRWKCFGVSPFAYCLLVWESTLFASHEY